MAAIGKHGKDEVMFAPGELCLVCTLKTRDRAALPALHRKLGELLDAQLTARLEVRPAERPDTPEAARLTGAAAPAQDEDFPESVRSDLAGAREVLRRKAPGQELQALRLRPAALGLRPAVLEVEAAARASRTAGPAPAEADEAPPAEADEAPPAEADEALDFLFLDPVPGPHGEDNASAVFFFNFGEPVPKRGLGALTVTDAKERLERTQAVALLGHAEVRDVAARLNTPRLFEDDLVKALVEKFVGVSPNWLTAGTPNGASGDSPGARPRPARRELTASGAAFRFPEGSPVHALPRDTKDSSVLVAVLDTCPSGGAVRAAAHRVGGQNWLLAQLVGEMDAGATFVMDHPPSLSQEYIEARLAEYVPNWRDKLRPDQDFAHADHGLFVAGIVRDVAGETAEIHLIRVLNDYGVGDLRSLARVLRQLPELQRRRGKRHLIVNLSLGAEAWPGEHLLHRWLPDVFARLRRKAPVDLRENVEKALEDQKESEALTLLTGAHAGLKHVVDWLGAQGALVVAAAGNDYDTEDPYLKAARQEPRLPARYDGVFGVAATDLRGQAAQYSNRGDVRILENGVAVFGGEARRLEQGALPEFTRDDTGVVGVWSGTTLPLDGAAVPEGWVEWAGTSFATPVISALAARYWSAHPDANNAEVIAGVRALGSPQDNGDLAVPVIGAAQRQSPDAGQSG